MHPEAWEREMSKFLADVMDGQIIRIAIGSTEHLVEVAGAPESRRLGLAGRNELPVDGMLFVYERDSTANFTREGMKLSVTLNFYDKDGKPVEGGWHGSFANIGRASAPYRYALELDPLIRPEGTLSFSGIISEARDFSADERKKLAQKGQALPDGSFPIVTVQDLRNAIQAFGRAGNKAAAKKHIIKRARALNKTDLLPEGWAS